MDATGNNKLINLIILSIIFLTIVELNKYVFFINKFLITNPIIEYSITYLISFFTLIFFFRNYNNINENIVLKNFIKLYFLYFSINIIFSFFFAQTYFQYKYIFISFIPQIVFVLFFSFGFMYENVKKIFRIYSIFFFPIGILLIFFNFYEIKGFYPRLFVPISFLLLFFPYFNKINKIFFIIFSFIILFIDTSHRTGTFSILFSIILILTYYFNIRSTKFYLFSFYNIIFIPLFFFILFFVFKIDIFEFISNSFVNNTDNQSDIFANTRSFLYINIFNELSNNNWFLFGGGAQASYTSEFFSKSLSSYGLLIYQEGRFASEIGFLNIILKSGIIGFFLYSFIFFYSSYIGITNSKNTFCKILSLKIIFFWFLLFIEIPGGVNLNSYFIYVFIGLVLSKKLRSLSDFEIREVFKF